MEINQITNREIKEQLVNGAMTILLNNNIVEKEKIVNTSIDFAYIFTKEDGVLEALYKVMVKDFNNYYFASQNNKIMLIEINEEQYNQTKKYMFENHSCLKENIFNETEIQRNRRIKNNNYLKELGIVTNDNLLCLYEDSNVKLKDIDFVCKKAIATFIAIQVACDINNNKYEESLKYFVPLLKKFNVEDFLNSKEKRILDGTYDSQDPIDMDWAYEIYWSICWALGIVDDIKDGGKMCDCNAAIDFVMSLNSVDDFKEKCKVRSIAEILDMQDLYFRYHWAINEYTVNPSVSIGNLNPSNVIERRRGLEWIISDVDDWYDLSLNA